MTDWEPFKEKFKETGKEFPDLEQLFKQSDPEKTYPFEHNPVVDNYVNEPGLQLGLNDAIKERIRKEQPVPDGYMKKLLESNIDEKEKYWPDIVETVRKEYGFSKKWNKDNTKYEWQSRESANLKKLRDKLNVARNVYVDLNLTRYTRADDM